MKNVSTNIVQISRKINLSKYFQNTYNLETKLELNKFKMIAFNIHTYAWVYK